MAGLLTLFGGVILLVAASPAIGVAIVLLSALYFALAEIIFYLAVIARNSHAAESFFRDDFGCSTRAEEEEELPDEIDFTSRSH